MGFGVLVANPDCGCRIGKSPNRVFIERLREEGKSYKFIRDQLKEQFGEVIYGRSFTDHFSRHVSIDVSERIRKLKDRLEREMDVAPPTVAPLYAVALRNIDGLEETKASQEHLIRSLKAIHEITGLQLHQRMLLTFAAERAKKLDSDSAGATPARPVLVPPVRSA